MDFRYSEEEKLLKQTVKDLLRDKFPLAEVRRFMESGTIPSSLTKLLASQGLLGPGSWDSELQCPAGQIYSVLIAYEAGRALLPFPLIENHVTAYILSKCGDEAAAEQLSSGEKLATVAWETNTSRTEKSDETFTLHGSFTYVPFAADADFMFAKVMLPDNSEQMARIRLKASGIRLSKRNSMDETYPLYNVTAEDYPLTSDDLLSSSDPDSDLFEEMKTFATLLLCADLIGGSEEILDRTVAYANERKQFGQTISSYQAIKHMAAESYLRLESCRSALDYATWAVDAGSAEAAKVVSLLKSYVSEACQDITGAAIQIHGGIGYTWESDVHLFFKRARRGAAMLGNSYYHREQIARYMLNEALTKGG